MPNTNIKKFPPIQKLMLGRIPSPKKFPPVEPNTVQNNKPKPTTQIRSMDHNLMFRWEDEA